MTYIAIFVFKLFRNVSVSFKKCSIIFKGFDNISGEDYFEINHANAAGNEVQLDQLTPGDVNCL